MSFYVEDKGGNFERCPSGMHLARCYRIIDLGTQKSEYMGQVGYQSLQFTTPIYPWLIANERKDTYYYPH